MAELTLKPVLNVIGKIIQDQLRRQAPVAEIKGGALRSSVAVRVVETPDGIEVIQGFLLYGRFLDSGTGRYRKPNPRAPFNAKPGKGKGGIKPRYWTNLGKATTAKIAKIITAEERKQIIAAIKTK